MLNTVYVVDPAREAAWEAWWQAKREEREREAMLSRKGFRPTPTKGKVKVNVDGSAETMA